MTATCQYRSPVWLKKGDGGHTIVTSKFQQDLPESILNDLCNFLTDLLTTRETH